MQFLHRCACQVDLTDYEKSGTWDVVDVPAYFRTFYSDKEGQVSSKTVDW